HVPIRCNVRIIAATHRNLEEAIARSAFREDLFHRLNVFPIETPPLRERLEDLPLLVRDFAAHNMGEGRGHVALSPRALAALALHRWPGNVRELANLIERLSIVCAGRIARVADLPAKYRPADWTADLEPCANEAMSRAEAQALIAASSSDEIECACDAPIVESGDPAVLPVEGIDLRAHLTAIERRLIEQALERSGGTVAHAARLLGLRRTTLVEKMRKLEMTGGEITTED
ncbi:MAG TPA: helix-turn-helix domain-containing protein, partial [Steroidobacteraceae bacterium]